MFIETTQLLTVQYTEGKQTHQPIIVAAKDTAANQDMFTTLTTDLRFLEGRDQWSLTVSSFIIYLAII